MSHYSSIERDQEYAAMRIIQFMPSEGLFTVNIKGTVLKRKHAIVVGFQWILILANRSIMWHVFHTKRIFLSLVVIRIITINSPL